MKKGVFTLTLIALAIVSCAWKDTSSTSSLSSYTPGVNECEIRFETILFTDDDDKTSLKTNSGNFLLKKTVLVVDDEEINELKNIYELTKEKYQQYIA